MRSLIILEVEHGETTDPLGSLLSEIQTIPHMLNNRVKDAVIGIIDYTVRVDVPVVPDCDNPGPNCAEHFGRCD